MKEVFNIKRRDEIREEPFREKIRHVQSRERLSIDHGVNVCVPP